ncbi:L-aspartate oxidase [Magnetococcales bacterium HHB-1]
MTHLSQQLYHSDFLIIGGGLAGLDLALRLADKGQVTVLTKNALEESNSFYAQGGIAAVLDPEDQEAKHIRDTLVAGANLSHDDTVQFVVKRGASSIRRLVDLGVNFTREGDAFHLTREGGHSERRVIHTADATGKNVMRALLARVKNTPSITLRPFHMAIDLITDYKTGRYRPGREDVCRGCYALDIKKDRVKTFQARFVILATGGAGKVYLYTSNPDTATGDGIAMATRAGCRVANMEFIQFHPTCLYHPEAKSFLISEAVRGEGGILRLKSGRAFMKDHHEKAELAPRDIVARAIDFEMKRTGDDCVFLDITHKGADFIQSHFPTIYESCLSFGMDMTKSPLPVVPAAHYTCGGIHVDLRGQTNILNLYAIGETSHTGLHGANRLASNSLLECVVFAQAVEEHIVQCIEKEGKPKPVALPLWDSFDTESCEEAVLITHNWDEIRRFMWNYVGIVRSDRRLYRARRRMELLQQEINHYYWNCRITPDLLELRNLAVVASLIIRSALHRKESRGLHYSTSYPERCDETWKKDTVLPIIEQV